MKRDRGGRLAVLVMMAGTLAMLLAGCETDSFMDPSVLIRAERTPVTLPILDRLDVIDEPRSTTLQITQVQPADLIPDVHPYVIGPGDLMTISIFELIQPGQEAVQTRRVDATGMVRLPIIGAVKASGESPQGLEQRIKTILANKGVLNNAMVSVVMQEQRQDTYSVIAEPETGGTAVGTYQIPKPNFRLLDALALARGVPGRTKQLLIYRQTALSPQVSGVSAAPAQATQPEHATPKAPANPSALIEQLMQGVGNKPKPETPAEPERPAPPPGLESGLSTKPSGENWVNVEGKGWVRGSRNAATEPGQTPAEAQQNQTELSDLITQRIIEIPYQKLLAGDMRYNIVIRPGDVIRVPSPTGGFVYIMGAINRPGSYVVPGENDLTLKELIASAGNLSQLAIPERVDLVRRVGEHQEAMVRLNLKAIFDGTEPDIFLKPNDLINIGTSFAATPLAIFRNGLRATYGFGFVLDRNFETDVFGQ